MDESHIANTKVTTPIDGFDQDSFDMGEGDEVPDLYDYFLKDMLLSYGIGKSLGEAIPIKRIMAKCTLEWE